MGRRRNKTDFDESLLGNMHSYGEYLERLTELAISMFDWKNLPKEIDRRFLEFTLFSDGQAVFFKDEDLDEYMALQVVTGGPLSVYRVPLKRRAYAVNGYQRDLNIDNSVIIYNNYLRTNSVRMVKRYARRLYDLDRTIDVNTRAQKTPVLVQGTESQRLTLLNLYKEFDGNAPVIFGDKNLDINGLKSISTQAPFVADKIYMLKTQIWNEALTYLGISNISFQKKERMLSDEVTRNMGGTIASRYSRLEARREAAEKINEMFGLDIEVEYREDYRQTDDENMIPGDSGEGDNPDQMLIDYRTR